MFKLKKTQRILKKSTYKSVLNADTKVVRKNLLLKAKKNNSTLMRIGLIVTKKVGNAVVRNKIKRLLRESFRKLPIYIKSKPYDIVFIARKSAKEADYFHIEKQLQSAITQALNNKKTHRVL